MPEVVHIAGQVLRALGRAHEAGIVHRDLKPDNVFLCQRDDDPMFVKLVDFGISKVARKAATANTLTRRGTVLGTAYYMSPEQAQAFPDIDGRTDLFSLGSIMFEALAGRPPHTGTAYEAILIDICTKDAPDVRDFAPELAEPLAQVIAHALERDRDKRFQSATEFYDALAVAAPGLLRTGGPGSRDAMISADNLRPASQPTSDVRVATVEGTAVRSRSGDARTQTRRTVVVGLVAALGAFAITVLLMTSRHHADAGALTPPEASVTAPAAPGESAQHASVVPPEASSSATVDAGAADARVQVSASAPRPTHRPARHIHAVPHVTHVTHAKPPATATHHVGGVASGLQLNTSGP